MVIYILYRIAFAKYITILCISNEMFIGMKISLFVNRRRVTKILRVNGTNPITYLYILLQLTYILIECQLIQPVPICNKAVITVCTYITTNVGISS